MSKFIKYDSIDNSYGFKLDRWLDYKLQDEVFVIQEKLDGANISFITDGSGHIKVASRNQYLGSVDTVSFYGVNEVLNNPDVQNFIEYLNTQAKLSCCEYQIYGELYGQGIQKRINYGPKRIKFFDIRKNGSYLPQKELYQFMANFDNLVVPVLAKVHGIKDALEFSETFTSVECEEDLAEGIVIKPWNKVIKNRIGERLILKKKAEHFSEKSKHKGPKVHKEREPLPQALLDLQDEFSSYINENRVLSYFSKEGRIESMKELSKAIPAILEDALADFSKDKEVNDFGKEERKALLTHVTKDVVDLLKKSLAGEF